MDSNQDDNVMQTRKASLQMLTERFRLHGFPASVHERRNVDDDGKEIDGEIMFYVLRIRKRVRDQQIGYDLAIIPDDLSPPLLDYQLERVESIVRSLHGAIEKENNGKD